jgi:hypothetical protein
MHIPADIDKSLLNHAAKLELRDETNRKVALFSCNCKKYIVKSLVVASALREDLKAATAVLAVLDRLTVEMILKGSLVTSLDVASRSRHCRWYLLGRIDSTDIPDSGL